MKTSRYSDSQILAILSQAQAGTPVAALCWEHGMSSATFYKWRAKYSGMDTALMARLKAEIIQEAMVKKW
jgi:putative transposase